MEPTTAPDAPTAPDIPADSVPFLRGKRLPSVILATGAAVAMSLAGLGIASAQTDDSAPTPPPNTAPAEGEGDGDRHRGCEHPHAGHHPHFRLSVAAEALAMSTADLKAELMAGRSLAQVAEAKGVEVQTVVDALVADATAMVETAVENGRITREQADTRIAALPERMQAFVERTRPAGDDREDGERRKGPGHGPGRPGPHKPNLEAAAGVLGMSADELRTALRAGTSLATLAEEKDVPVGQVVSALVADAKARLAQAVTDGELTQAQADERSADLDQRITDLVNRTHRPKDATLRT